MIRLASKHLDAPVQQILDNLQQRVNNEPSFDKKTKKVQSLWNSKGGKKGKDAFTKIGEVLYSLTIFEGLCNYCEQSEANDIEHIDPKSFFPEKAFVWENYLLACKQCNSGLKLDKCHVLNLNNELVEVIRGSQPPFHNVAFINPRLEDPGQFMLLNLQSFKFEILPGLSRRDENRVKSTLDILELNNRDPLIQARKSAGQHYFEKLDRLVRMLEVRTKKQLKNLLNPFDNRFDFTKTLKQLKEELKDSHRIYISKYQHPSVWHSIKVIESQVDLRWQTLFNKLPEALNW